MTKETYINPVHVSQGHVDRDPLAVIREIHDIEEIWSQRSFESNLKGPKAILAEYEASKNSTETTSNHQCNTTRAEECEALPLGQVIAEHS